MTALLGGIPAGAPAGRRGGARAVAYTVLRRTFEHGAYTDRALDAELRRSRLDARERAQARALAFGAVQRRATLDALIERLAERPPRQLDAPLLAALRLGLYELLYQDGAPDRAVVSEAVELAKSASPRGGHALVNAVLRRAAREGRGLAGSLGSLADDATPAGAALMHSHPVWLAQLWFEQLGRATALALMAAGNEPAETALRANTLVTDALTLAGELPVGSHALPGWPDALVLDGPFDAHGSPLFAAGAFMPQARAAMLVGRVLAPLAGESVLDLCAAPGAKTTHLAALMGGRGTIVAVERHAGRARALEQTCARLRAGSVRVERADATDSLRQGSFDRVLVDPPCSGLGTLAARPDLRWRVTPAALAELVATQARLLAAGARAVRAGGTLVYSTCTISAAENERQVEGFLHAHRGWRLDDLHDEYPTLAHPRAGDCLLTLPPRDGTAGFFIARLRRTADGRRS